MVGWPSPIIVYGEPRRTFFYRINEPRINTGAEKDAYNLFCPMQQHTIRKALSSSLERNGDLYIKYKLQPSFT